MPPAESGDDVRLTVAGVAARLGVAAPTLRTWDRRYGLGPSDHVAGSHRRYGAGDLARLETMRRLTLEGVAPADAARVALQTGSLSVPSPEEPEGQQESSEPIVADPLTVAAAAVDGDGGRLRRLVRHAQRQQGLMESWVMTLRPALEMVGQRTVPDRPGHDPEQVLQAALLAELSDLDDGRDVVGRAIVHAADSYRTDAHVLAAELTSRGVQARVTHPRLMQDEGRALLDLVAGSPGTLTVLLGEPAEADPIVDELADTGEQVFLIALTDRIAPRRGLHRARTLSGAVHEIVSLLTPRQADRVAAEP